MKILKVNELNAETYLRAAGKLRSMYSGNDHRIRSFELIKHAGKKRKLEGEYWIRRPQSKENEVVECWIIPSVKFWNVRKDLKFNRNNEAKVCDFQIIFNTFEFDPLDFRDYERGSITLDYQYWNVIDENGEAKLKIYRNNFDRYFIFSNRKEVLKFKKAMKDWNWTKNNSYSIPEDELTEEEQEDIIWEHQILKTVENEFNKLPINFFYSE